MSNALIGDEFGCNRQECTVLFIFIDTNSLDCYCLVQDFSLLYCYFAFHSDKRALKLVIPSDLVAGAVKAKLYNWHEPALRLVTLAGLGGRGRQREAGQLA